MVDQNEAYTFQKRGIFYSFYTYSLMITFSV